MSDEELGLEICSSCEGSGIIKNRTCNKCGGRGKINWIDNAMAPKYLYAVWGKQTVSIDDEKEPEFLKELMKAEAEALAKQIDKEILESFLGTAMGKKSLTKFEAFLNMNGNKNKK